jgi:ATP-binding cassette subfamily C protein
LAPVDLAIANWRGFIAARQSWERLSRLLAHLPVQAEPLPLQPPQRTLVVQGGAVTAPGMQKIICQDVNFTLAGGKALGVIGPTASGKSSLARMLVGIWTPVRGSVRLDGASIEQWSPEALGRHVGYLPQDVELFPGNVAQNIARFEDPPNPEAVLAAAQAAGVHDLIVNLPEGYETSVGDHGNALSAGQAQRIGLARALYRDPFLVVLDEPNSNLDAEGDEALTQAILGVRARGGIVIVVAHRPSAIAGVDYILVMAKGRQQQFGPKEDVLNRVIQPPAQPRALKVVPEQQGGAG